MWAALQRHLLARRAANVAAAGSCGLWKAPHVSQCRHWDCGVACAQMVLQGLGREVDRSSLLASLRTQSVWTIDLAMLLHRQGVRFTYCTRTAGVTETYSTVDFYRANFDRDAFRVQSLFKEAEEAKVGAVQKSFSWQELAVLVSGYDYAAIVLVDSRYLYPATHRTPAPGLAPPSPAAASAAAVTAAAATSPANAVRLGGVSPAWSTPKHLSEDDEGGVFRGGRAGDDEGGAPSRRRRRRPRASQGNGRQHRGAEVASVRAAGPMRFPSARSAPNLMAPLVLSSIVPGAEQATSGRDARENLRVCPAPHSLAWDGEMVSQFVTPPLRQTARKMLGREPHGALEFSDALKRQRRDGPRDRAETGLRRSSSAVTLEYRPSTPTGTPPPPADPREAGSPPRFFPVLASPPPLKRAAMRAPPVSVTSSTGSPGPCHEAAPSDGSSYCGHYILLVGWSEADGVFIARDPALPPPSPATAGAAPVALGGRGDPGPPVYMTLTPEALDRARLSYGTDEDVVVVDLACSRKGGVTAAPLAAAAAATALAASAASSAAAASALVGLFAMAAAAAAARADASGFKEWAWPDPAAWFGGYAPGGVAGGEGGGIHLSGSGAKTSGGVGGGDGVGVRVGVAGEGLSQGGMESAAKRLASLLSLAASGWRFPTVGDAYRGPRVPWKTGGWGATGGGSGSDLQTEEERERWDVRMASAMEGLLQGGRRAAYTMEGFLQGGAHTVEGLLEGGRRAAYSFRDSLADAVDSPGGAGAECCTALERPTLHAWNPPGSPVSPSIGAVMSPA